MRQNLDPAESFPDFRALVRRIGWALACLGLGLAAPQPASACFGARLRVGVPASGPSQVAGFAAGYYVEEKTGIEPEFVVVDGDPLGAFTAGRVDVQLVPHGAHPPETVVVREAGEVPGLGPARFWVHREVLDDLRFTTVDRALTRIGEFYRSDVFRALPPDPESARKAARQAVLHAD